MSEVLETAAGDAPASSANGNGRHRLFGAIRNLKPLRIAAPPPEAPLPDDPAYGMHGVTRSVDVWFDYQVNDVKKEALQLAGEWAQAAIPKVDVAYTEIPPETILAKRCTETLRRWRERLVNKVQDAINQLTGRIGVMTASQR
jgi:hypothetical protein